MAANWRPFIYALVNSLYTKTWL